MQHWQSVIGGRKKANGNYIAKHFVYLYVCAVVRYEKRGKQEKRGIVKLCPWSFNRAMVDRQVASSPAFSGANLPE